MKQDRGGSSDPPRSRNTRTIPAYGPSPAAPEDSEANSERGQRGRDYDRLPADEQARIRAAWDEGIEARLASSDVAADKHAAGQPVITLDEEGNIVCHLPDGTIEGL